MDATTSPAEDTLVSDNHPPGWNEPLIYNGDQVVVGTQRFVIESGALEPGTIPLYRVGGTKLNCRRVEDTGD